MIIIKYSIKYNPKLKNQSTKNKTREYSDAESSSQKTL